MRRRQEGSRGAKRDDCVHFHRGVARKAGDSDRGARMHALLAEEIPEDGCGPVDDLWTPRKAGDAVHEAAESHHGPHTVEIAVAGEAQAVEQVERADPRGLARGLDRNAALADRPGQNHLAVPLADLP